ncbi:outer membrane protein transport protein [Acinetobacter thermotolerans]|uniref:outer membrane protein transport protein n=1 Tax=Acinetobacter thermotolerans TaxID=3151487 RepID=UPI00325C1A2A
MKLKALSTAMILAALPMTGAFAAAMDRSGQSMAAFLQPGNYFEAGISILDADVSGREAGETTTRRDIDDMAESYYFPNAALKIQATDNFSIGLLYDQPFGAKAKYTGNNAFVSDYGTDTILPQTTLNNMLRDQIRTGLGDSFDQFNQQALGGNFNQASPEQIQAALNATAAQYRADVEGLPETLPAVQQALATATALEGAANNIGNALNSRFLLGEGNTVVDLKSQNLSLVFGYQPTVNWNLYAGAVYQTVEGDLSLRGQAYSIYNGYDATLPETDAWGWLAGFAYQIPEIALKASVTYRSEIEHEANARESLPALAALSLIDATQGPVFANAIANATGKSKFTTPQSVNIDLQSGIMQDTVAFLNVRWVDWSEFALRPLKFGMLSEVVGQLDSVNRPNGFDIVKYDKDQWTATAGVGRKLSEKWAGNVSVGWDSGAGNPITTLGPTDGYWNVGLGVQYSPAPNYFIAGGVKYFWLGDAESQTAAQVGEDNRIVGDFKDNNAIAYGLKIGYRF